QAIRSYQNFPVQGKAAAALRLEPIARIYAGIQQSATETAQIEGLLVDLNKEQNKADITTLGLKEVVTQLQQTNDQYKSIEQSRAQYKLTGDYVKSGRRARQLITPLLDELILLANARAIIGPTDGLTLFIRTANTIWAEELTGYRIARSQTSGTPADDPADPDADLTDPDTSAGNPTPDPSDSSDPSDDSTPDPDNHSTIGTGVVDAQ
ncbi:MAG: hypothetical protein IJ680_02405, partial [Paludibacteraceae bacterium]|nr:hypothetical protein [Paludibacteraceae bacterium]